MTMSPVHSAGQQKMHQLLWSLLVSQVQPINPVRTPLPRAPDFKLYCFYGVGTPTERGYHYLKTQRGGATEWAVNNLLNDPQSGLVREKQLPGCGMFAASASRQHTWHPATAAAQCRRHQGTAAPQTPVRPGSAAANECHPSISPSISQRVPAKIPDTRKPPNLMQQASWQNWEAVMTTLCDNHQAWRWSSGSIHTTRVLCCGMQGVGRGPPLMLKYLATSQC